MLFFKTIDYFLAPNYHFGFYEPQIASIDYFSGARFIEVPFSNAPWKTVGSNIKQENPFHYIIKWLAMKAWNS